MYVVLRLKSHKHFCGILGTNGGISAFGVLFSFLGGLLIGIAHYVTLLYTVDVTLLERAPPQWPIILLGGLGGLFGSLIDSFIGATFQYSGICPLNCHNFEQEVTNTRA